MGTFAVAVANRGRQARGTRPPEPSAERVPTERTPTRRYTRAPDWSGRPRRHVRSDQTEGRPPRPGRSVSGVLVRGRSQRSREASSEQAAPQRRYGEDAQWDHGSPDPVSLLGQRERGPGRERRVVRGRSPKRGRRGGPWSGERGRPESRVRELETESDEEERDGKGRERPMPGAVAHLLSKARPAARPPGVRRPVGCLPRRPFRPNPVVVRGGNSRTSPSGRDPHRDDFNLRTTEGIASCGALLSGGTRARRER